MLLIGSLASVLLCMCLSKPKVDTRRWRLAEFIDHLLTHGMKLEVIPTVEDGRLGDNVCLTENSNETWASFQLKVKSVERIDQWRGSVWVAWNDPRNPAIRHLASPS